MIMNQVMKMIRRRIEKLEQLHRNLHRGSSYYVAFAWDKHMRITRGDEVAFEGPVAQGKAFIQGISEDATVIRFNIPRPPILRGSVISN